MGASVVLSSQPIRIASSGLLFVALVYFLSSNAADPQLCAFVIATLIAHERVLNRVGGSDQLAMLHRVAVALVPLITTSAVLHTDQVVIAWVLVASALLAIGWPRTSRKSTDFARRERFLG